MTLVLNGTTGVSSVDGSASTPAIQGGDSNTGIFFPAADTVAIATGGTERVRTDSSGNVGIGTSSPTDRVKVVGGNVQVPRDSLLGSSATGNAIVVGTSGGSQIKFVQSGSDDELAFITHKNGVSHAERARIDSSGNLLVNTTSQNDSGQFSLTVASGRNGIGISVGSTAETGQIIFRNPNGVVGRVYTTNSTTTYATSSDYRLKEDVQPMTGALAKVSALKPCTYKWKVDGTDGQGFIAHELQEVVPECVSGQKDAVDEEGNIVPQGIDTSFLVATLTAAIQEQQALINDLTARIAALEAK